MATASSDTSTEPTPMMKQYAEIKAVNPDSLLFYRMGDFYELFFHDAEIAAGALGITLTKRGKHLGEDIPMCGVPVHAADDYLQKLIGFGYRVAVCEQTEDPAEAKKRGSKAVVKRDVVRLVTPGTITEEKILDPGASNFFATIAHAKSTSDELPYAVAWIDISTGSFSVSSASLAEVPSLLARIEPRELVISETLYENQELRAKLYIDDRNITLDSPSFFDSQLSEERIKSAFEIHSIDSIGSFSKAELGAAGAALSYIEKTQIDARPSLQKLTKEDTSDSVFIDPATRSNLELTSTLSGEKIGSLINAIDHTVSGPGSRLMAERMMRPLRSIDEIKRRQDSVQTLLDNSDTTSQIRASLKQCSDITRAMSRLSLGRGGPRDMKGIQNSLQIAAHLCQSLEQIDLPSELSSVQDDFRDSPEKLADLLQSALSEELPLLARDGGFVRSGFHDELDQLRQLRDDSRKIIAEMQSQFSTETGVKNLKIKHNNVLGYFIEVGTNHSEALTSDEAKAKFIHRQTLANVMRFTTVELSEIESQIANAAGKALEIELEIFERLRSEIFGQSETLARISNSLAILDVSQSNATLAEKWNYCRPTVDNSLAFDVEGGRHPVIEQVLRGSGENPFIANDCSLGDQDNPEIWLLTGPNMGGKSTFLRQNALICILAQMGCYVPATKAHIGVINKLFSRVGAADDLARGRSTFMVEMVETAAILNQADERSFVILDEIGRGTATYDGLSIAWAAIEYLHEKNKCRTLFATHYHELTTLTSALDRLANVTLKVKEWEGEVIFLHEVIKGTADRSYGIQVAKLAGLPEAVIERSKQVLQQLEDVDSNNEDKRFIDDLPLFSVDVKAPAQKTSSDDILTEELLAIVPDELSPKDALDLVYKLRAKAIESSN